MHLQAEKKAAKEAAKAKAAAASAASSPPSSQAVPAAQPDSAAAASATAAVAKHASVVPRRASSIAKADNRSTPAAPSGVESHTAPSSSSRQLLARQQSQRGSERARDPPSSPFRGAPQGD